MNALKVERRLPVLLFDVMSIAIIEPKLQDTIVRDPFFHAMPAHFGMSFKELLAAKHPTTWVEFEKGLLTEEAMLPRFFADGRAVDGDKLKAMLVRHYEFLPGMRELLSDLRSAGYEMHAISNYPVWYKLIEDKLQLSQWIQWSFVSSDGQMKGFRKPEDGAYKTVLSHLDVSPVDLVIVDDRAVNVEAAVALGMQGVTFTDADDCRAQLARLGILEE